MLIVDRFHQGRRVHPQQGFNLTLEMLIVDRDRVDIIQAMLAFSFNLTLEMLIVDRAAGNVSPGSANTRFQSHT